MRRIARTRAAIRRIRVAAVALVAAGTLAGAGAVAPAAETPEPPLAVELQGILGSKAVLQIEGRRHVLGAGDTTPEGVRLESVEREAVTVTLGGESRRIELGSSVTRGYTARGVSVARVYPDPRGMYVAIGSINGFAVPMLLDTGATYVAIDGDTARRLGVNHRLRGTPVTVHTAAGPTTAFEVLLDSVGLGEISLRGVEAYVIEGQGPGIPLLGMSFLRRLEVSTESGAMVLRARH